MAYAPDYGLAMLQSGVGEDAAISFSPFYLTHISMLEDRGFTTSVNVPIGKVDHALTVDFSADALDKMLSFGPDNTAQLALDWLQSDPISATLDLPEPIELDISLIFGEVQSNDDEHYVPMVVQQVLPPYGLLDQYQVGEDGK